MPRAGADNGGMVARRAVVRWAVRLFRREWRQQLAILALVTLAVTGAVAGSSIAYGRISTQEWQFGDADKQITLSSDDPDLLAQRIEDAQEWFGEVEVIGHDFRPLAGWDGDLDVRAIAENGRYSSPTLDVVDGEYPAGKGEVALTDDIATLLGVSIGDDVAIDGTTWTMVGLVRNPGDFDEEFAVVSPEHAAAPTEVELLLRASPDQVIEWPAGIDGVRERFNERGGSDKAEATGLLLTVEAVVLMLVALISTTGFVVLAHRRQRQIGLLAATGATDKHLRLVMLANGVVVGAVAAAVGTVVGIAIWFAAAPSVEASAGHAVDRFDLPWVVVLVGGLLGVVATAVASWWPARAVSRLPVTATLSGRPPEPKRARRTAIPGLVLLAAGAGAIVWVDPNSYLAEGVSRPSREMALTGGAVAIALGMLLVCPLAVRLLTTGARRLPLAPRLAIRDLARYRARTSAALAAISLALGIPLAMVLVTESTEKRGDEGNLSSRQMVVSMFENGAPVVVPQTPAQLDEAQERVGQFTETLDDPTVVPLLKPWDPDVEPEPGFEQQRWAVDTGIRFDDGYRDVTTYVATPELLAYLGIDPNTIPAGTEVITDETSDLTILGYEDPGESRDQTAELMRIDVSPYSAAPGTMITEELIRERGWETAPSGWFVESSSPLTGEQLAAAREMAVDLGFEVQARTDYSNSDLRGISIAVGAVLALAIVAMTVGLIRGEATEDLRMLAATGADAGIRRSLTAVTAGALGLLGVLVGGFGAYVGLAAGYVREPQFLGRVPIVELLIIGLGTPLLAAGAGWLLGGREPASLIRPRLPMASIVVLFALVATAGACGGDDDGGGGGAGDADSRDPLPLQEYEDAILGTGDGRAAQERHVQQRIADCMTARGFEYVAVEPHPGLTPDASADSPWSLPADEFAERYGYGIFTIEDPAMADPNAAIVDAMSESERSAYEQALRGEGGTDAAASSGPASGEADGGGEEPTPDVETAEDDQSASCSDQAWEEEMGAAALTSDEFAGLNEDLNALFEREQSDPRIEDAAREWADCMADEDPDYADFTVPDDALSSVVERFSSENSTLSLESMEMEGSSRMVHRLLGVDLSALDPDRLREMRDYEIAVASADQRCRADYDAVEYEVRFEYEDEFVEEHRLELDRFREALASATDTTT